MRFHRAINGLTLAAFLPLAVGCSSQLTVPLASDPGGASPLVAADKSVEIRGYTTADSVFHDWNGQVRTAEADSLDFTRRLEAGRANRPPGDTDAARQETIRLAKAQVVSVDVVDRHPVRTIALGFGLVVVLLAGLWALDLSDL